MRTGALSGAALDTIPVYRARLPPAAAILPYLQRLDASRRYANRGELVVELEARLRATLGLGENYIVSAASGTAALTGAILATAGRATAARPIAIVAGYTFVATALAAEACGYRVVFADIQLEKGGPDTWTLDPAALRRHPALGQTGVVLPVAPYGVAPAQAPWTAFQERTGVAVVIDAAASFEAIRRDPDNTVGSIPVALSFHATKAFSTGEGGAVAWSSVPGLTRIAQALNFGFLGTRECRSPGFNGKLSEYHAAVGLASLDTLDETDALRADLASRYRAAATNLADHLLVAPAIASNYALFDAVTPAYATRLRASLRAAGVEYRDWYGAGSHAEPYFRNRTTGSLTATETLATRLIGIPMFDDLSDPEIARIVEALGK